MLRALRLLLLLPFFLLPPALATRRQPGGAIPAAREWRVYGGDAGATRFSVLNQINRGNVARLKVAWTFHAGDSRASPPSTIECNPIVVRGVLYLTSPTLKVMAVDAAMGTKRWEVDPGQREQRVSRGVSYWESGGDRRIFFTTGSNLYALDAATGRPIPSFGRDGRVDLREGLGRDLSRARVAVTTPGAVIGDLLLLGSSVDEGPGPAAPGHVRAYDVRTGKQAWIFHTIPQPGEFGYETWPPDAWKSAGGANCWGGMSVDEKRGAVYVATGSPTFDFFGSDRHGQNLFGNCVVALEARTGRRLWHFQTVHHDLWDYDLPCPPVLVTLRQGGRTRDAVAQVGKTGFVYVLDRDSGQPVFPIEERPVPSSDLEGEAAWPTQPFPLKPPAFTRQRMTEADVTDLTPSARADVLARFRQARSTGIFAPPCRQGSIVFPGFHGGANWSGASFDPTTGRLFVNANEIPFLLTMKETPPGDPYRSTFTGYFRFLDPDGYPAVKPPWGTLTAVDLNRGELAWRVPLGEYAELKAKGVPPTGTETFGGSIATAGGLVFIGATKDRMFRAIDRDTGRTLWQAELEAGGNATPSTYEAAGKQYVVIAAGGGSGQRVPEARDSKPGDAFVAFALP